MPRTAQLLIALLAAAAAIGAASAQDADVPTGSHDYVAYPDEPAVTHHTVTINGEAIHYEATAGTVTHVDESRDPTARMFYIAYRRTLMSAADHASAVANAEARGETAPRRYPDAADRPVTFSFNGGPGSSSVWLHLGIFGPKRVAYADDKGNPGPPPYAVIDNAHSLLDHSDFVFIDPISTGFSRAEVDGDPKSFHGVEPDIASVGEFIRRYITTEERWRSPRFVAGESYGTTRAAGLAEHLFERHGIALNGMLLISSVMQFQTLRFDTGNDLPYILILPGYTATAWYHGALADREQGMPLEDLLAEVEDFALGEYASALLQGDRLTEREHREIVAKVARYTGLEPEYVERANLRVSQSRFGKELLRDQGLTVGRLDSRFTARDRDNAGERNEFDPSYSAILGNYTGSLNSYVREDLAYESDLPYEILTNVWPWEFAQGGNNRYLDVAERLRSAMHQVPGMRVFIASGYYDLATPFTATDHTLAQMMLADEYKPLIDVEYYESGHMMYVHQPSLEKLKRDLDTWYESAIPNRD